MRSGPGEPVVSSQGVSEKRTETSESGSGVRIGAHGG
jgi:hypothetical protein